jgi:hypothetical protein
MHVFEDYIEDIGSEDIATDGLEVSLNSNDVPSGYNMSI